MIIGIAGRCRSGKTELAKICQEMGYRKLYFALPLKQLCADILDISIEGLNKAKDENTNIALYLGDDICTILSEETDIPLEQVKETCHGKILNTVREMLQFIGTDLIRKYNSNWHVDRMRQMIDINYDYVIDDVRFPNEKKLIEDLGGDCWFISRTTLDNISNHESETSITWHNCWNKVIINDGTLNYLQFRWKTFMEDYKKSCEIRDKKFENILENGLPKETENSGVTLLDMLFLPSCIFEYSPLDIEKENVKSVKLLDNGDAQITYKDNTLEIATNKLVIEDLKKLI